jgi:methyltransferase family protein
LRDQNSNTISITNYPDNNNDEIWKHTISSITFSKPIVVPQSAWAEHIPFAFWIIDALKPNLLVELGTHYGLSYFSFCQAIQQKKINTKCFAIDTWKGDEHAGFYDDSVFEFVNKTNEGFSSFSTLERSTFDEAITLFKDKSIDLLHIDGLHTYEAVKHDFYNWLPKISEKGIVLFHDTNVMERGFGVYQLWEELIKEYPFFEFKHGYGLGILGVGKKSPSKINELFKASLVPQTRLTIQEIYQRLGNLYLTEQEYYKKLYAQKEAGDPLIKNEFIAGTLPEINNLKAEKYLHPLQTICTQVFWANKDAAFNEASSQTQSIEITNTKSSYLFNINQDFSFIKKLRIDPATEQGIFYLHSISISNSSGKILLNWEAVKEISAFYNLVIFKSTLLENTFVFISTTNDPIVEIELPEINYAAKTDSVNLVIEVSKPDDESLNKELSNITIDELKKEQHNNIMHVYNTFFENLQSTKKEINDIISSHTNEILFQFKKESLTTYNKLEEEKNNLEKELKEQRLFFNKNINETNVALQKKEETINDLLKRIEAIRETETALQQDLFRKNLESKSLTEAFKKSNRDLAELDTKRKEEIGILKNQLDELLKKFENKKLVIEENQKELLLKEATILDMENKISEYKAKYENNSIFGIIKSRIINPKKNN